MEAIASTLCKRQLSLRHTARLLNDGLVLGNGVAGSVTSSNALLVVLVPPSLALQLWAGYSTLNPAPSDRLKISPNRSTPKIKARSVPRPRSDFQPD
jgi:hypothetical protein